MNIGRDETQAKNKAKFHPSITWDEMKRAYSSRPQDEVNSQKCSSETRTSKDFKTSLTIHYIGRENAKKSNHQGRQNDRP